ncbi:DnaJ domain-containing protein [uncultured Draconibacterium sp.]|uniref:DnaJ domain-containing protein n=1 Tax=uncultured Draconibacterium sp. TaxID=1573823 RepID=UPI003260AC22
MQVFKDFYRILQVKPDASFNDIKQAFVATKSLYHPDSSSSKISKADMVDAIVAHGILTSISMRRLYDVEYKKYLNSGCSADNFYINTASLHNKIIEVRKKAHFKIMGIVLQIAGDETKGMTTGAFAAAKDEIRSGVKMYVVWLIIVGIILLIALITGGIS